MVDDQKDIKENVLDKKIPGTFLWYIPEFVQEVNEITGPSLLNYYSYNNTLYFPVNLNI